jgi:hypothetical protein
MIDKFRVLAIPVLFNFKNKVYWKAQDGCQDERKNDGTRVVILGKIAQSSVWMSKQKRSTLPNNL